jgi:hypothetical protein
MVSTTTAELPPMDFDQMLDEATLPEDEQRLCLNGRLMRQYEAVAARVAERTEAHHHEASREANAGAGGTDTRLSTKAAAKAKPYVDPEQGELDRLAAEGKRWTITVTLRALDTQIWNDLFAKHSPRRDDKTGAIDQRDSIGVNCSTFFKPLLRLSILSPEMTDARFDKFVAKLTDAQFDRLAMAAWFLNRSEQNIPF